MSKKVKVDVPSVQEIQMVDISSLENGQIVQHQDGYAVKIYDGLFTFNPENIDEMFGTISGDQLIAYSEDELQPDRCAGDFSEVVLRNDLRLKITLEQVEDDD